MSSEARDPIEVLLGMELVGWKHVEGGEVVAQGAGRGGKGGGAMSELTDKLRAYGFDPEECIEHVCPGCVYDEGWSTGEPAGEPCGYQARFGMGEDVPEAFGLDGRGQPRCTAKVGRGTVRSGAVYMVTTYGCCGLELAENGTDAGATIVPEKYCPRCGARMAWGFPEDAEAVE